MIKSSHFILEIEYDNELFSDILNCLDDKRTEFIPDLVWKKLGGWREDTNLQYNAKEMMQHWVGYAKNPITKRDLFWWYESLHEIDHLGLLEKLNVSADDENSPVVSLAVSDLGHIWDMNIATNYLDAENREIRVLEVGAGYGRLCEFFMNALPKVEKYVLIDVVPASLHYAYRYLVEVFGQDSVGAYFRRDKAPHEYQIYITVPWDEEVLSSIKFNLAMNIQSMQEMTQSNVDFYLDLFNKLLVGNGGWVYLCNRRDHVFKGEWNIPVSWVEVIYHASPRSWIREFPSELYNVENSDYFGEIPLVDIFHRQFLEGFKEKKVLEARRSNFDLY